MNFGANQWKLFVRQIAGAAAVLLAACAPDRSAPVQQWLQEQQAGPVAALPPLPDAAGLELPAMQLAAGVHPFRPALPSMPAADAPAPQGLAARSPAAGVYVGWMQQGQRRMGVLQRDAGWLIVQPGDTLEAGETVQQLDERHLVLRYAAPERRLQLLLQQGGQR